MFKVDLDDMVFRVIIFVCIFVFLFGFIKKNFLLLGFFKFFLRKFGLFNYKLL